MLSRIAESLFWIGRYIERAETTARALDVHLQLLVEDPTIDHEAACRSLLAAMGVPANDKPDRDMVLRLLLHDPNSPTSVAHAIASARESARRSREVVSTEMWEALNTTYNQVSHGQLAGRHPADAFRMVRERANLICALSDNTVSHDAGWRFQILGRYLERADLTARLVLVRAHTVGSESDWQMTLRLCGAHHSFTRTYNAIEAPRAAVEFLILDRLFPRSVVFGLTQAESCLEALDPRQPRVGFGGDAARIIGRARAGLEITPVSELLARYVEEMQAVQRVCADATEALRERYFEGAAAPEWLGGTQ